MMTVRKVLLIILCVFAALLPSAVASVPAYNISGTLSLRFTGNHEVHLIYGIEDQDGKYTQQVKGELYVNGRLWRSYQEYDQWATRHTGLSKGATYTYEWYIYVWDNEAWQLVKKLETATVTGQVSGMLYENAAWLSGTYDLAGDITVLGNARLAIGGDATVYGHGHSLSAGLEGSPGALIIDGGALQDLSISHDYDSPGRITIQNSTLEDVNMGNEIRKMLLLHTFSHNRGSGGVYWFGPPREGGQLAILDNDLPGSALYISNAADITVQDNTIGTLNVYMARSARVSGNVLTRGGPIYPNQPDLNINLSGGASQLVVEYNQADGLKLMGPDTSTIPAFSGLVRYNTFSPLEGLLGGIHLASGGLALTVSDNTIVYQESQHRPNYGIYIDSRVSGSRILNNEIYGPFQSGVTIYNTPDQDDAPTQNNLVQGNVISGPVNGVYISVHGTQPNAVRENEITCQGGFNYGGISMWHASGQTIQGNTISGCSTGILLYGEHALPTNGNVIRDNILTQNAVNVMLGSKIGINDNTIYNNLFVQGSQSQLISEDEGVIALQSWYIPKQAGENIVGGPYLGGNYWSDYEGADADGDGIGDAPYQITGVLTDALPLVVTAGPNLRVRPFSLRPGMLRYVEASQKYVMDVSVDIHNNGDAPASDIRVRFTDNGTLSETHAIAALAAGARKTLDLAWDITPILAQGKGKHRVAITVTVAPPQSARIRLGIYRPRWRGEVDPPISPRSRGEDLLLYSRLQGKVEMTRADNVLSRELWVDVQPDILAVQPQFYLDSGYFLDNQDVPNRVKVAVDWNGELPGSGEAPYGNVVFELNGAQGVESGEAWGAAHTYNMGQDFEAAMRIPNNLLHIWAVYPTAAGDFESLRTTIRPSVFPYPDWITWLMAAFNPSLGTFDAPRLNPPVVQYPFNFSYPTRPFEANWNVPAWVPYVGGKMLGILETQAQAGALGGSNGAGEVSVGGSTGLGLGLATAPGSLQGTGAVRFRNGQSLDLGTAQLIFDIQVPVEQEADLTKVVPGVKKAEDWWLVGRFFKWFNNVARVKGSFNPRVTLQTDFREQDGQLEFDSSTGRGEIDAAAELAVQPISDLSATAFGKGTPYIIIQVPEPQNALYGYLKDLGIIVNYGVTLQAWGEEATYDNPINCTLLRCEPVSEETLLRASGLPERRLIPRTYVAPDYATFVARDMHGSSPLSYPELGTITITTEMLLSNIYPYPAPDLAVRDDGQRLLLYLHDDPAKPHGRGTEVYALSWNGAWVPPVALTDNAQPDFAPAVAFDGEGNGVAVWERATLAPGITPALDITFTQSFEIAACAWNGTSWEDPVTLTHNALMDHAPQLSGGADGSLMAMWQSHDGFDILGTPAHPLTYTYALWDGGMWLTPTTALTGVHDVLDMAFAAYSSTHAALVTARDLDGDTGTITDTALFYSTFDGMTWAAPAQLSPADGGAMNIAPALAYDAEGKLHLLWLHGEPGEQALLWLHDSWDISQAVTLRPASSEGGLLGFSLERAPAGHVALSWQAMGEEGTELRYRLYDAKADLWSADRILATGTVVERAHRSAFGNDGTLYMAYQSVAMDFITRTLGTSATLTVITNIPRLGESNLAFLTHAVGRDLALDAFTATPANPQPGERVTLTAVLRNAGDLAVQNPQVLFCLPPPVGRTCRGLEESTEGGLGLWGGTHTLPSLAAGYTTTVSLTWQVPLTAETHMLRAVADPGDLVIETEEGNNEKWLNIPLPDISVDILYTRPEAGQLVATARLTNTGSLAVTTPFSVAFRADQVTGTLLGSAMADIGINGWATATCALSDIAALAGSSARLWAVADAGAVVAEFNEDNNTAFTALDILPDLALTAEDIQGDGKLAVTLHNHGPLMATQVPLMVRDGSLSGGLLSSVTLASVAPGGIAQLEAQLAPGTYTLFVDIDPDNRIPELREGNNLAVREVMLTSYTTYSYVYVPLLLRTWEAAQ